jgi:hypothetical protein
MSNKFKLGHTTSNIVKNSLKVKKVKYPNEGQRRLDYVRMLMMPKKVKKLQIM